MFIQGIAYRECIALTRYSTVYNGHRFLPVVRGTLLRAMTRSIGIANRIFLNRFGEVRLGYVFCFYDNILATSSEMLSLVPEKTQSNL